MPRAPRHLLRGALLALGAALLLGAAGAALFVAAGAYDVSADTPHTQPVYTLMEIGKTQSVRRRARDIAERPLDDPALVRRGGACFVQHCVACHGAPGVAPAPPGLAMQPLPGPLADAAATWRQRELVWIVRHGIRMSGMPSWRERLADDDIWAVTALLQQLPRLSVRQFAELAREVNGQTCTLDAALQRPPEPHDDLAAGADAIRRHGCHGCHVIPGIVGPRRHFGPPLEGFARRTQIAGRLPNTPEHLQRWLRDPQAVKPHSAMPALGIGDADARAIAAYLARLQ